MTSPSSQPTNEAVLEAIKQAYDAHALAPPDHSHAENVAKTMGYTAEDLTTVPDNASLGLSCGNPIRGADIKQGEIVLDLGSGGGIDIFLASEKVGKDGQAIGIDGSTEMIALARKNAASRSLKPPHVAFVHSSLLEPLPINSGTVDVVVSNCVLNLLPHDGKAAVVKEIYRVLKPGGRVFIDDILAKRPLPDEVRNDLGLHAACFAGATVVQDYHNFFADAGFEGIKFIDNSVDLNAYEKTSTSGPNANCCAPASNIQSTTPTFDGLNFDPNEWLATLPFPASHKISASKPLSSAQDEKTNEGSPDKDVLAHWWDAYPVVRSSPTFVTPEQVSTLIRDDTKVSGKDYTVVDVRRNDHGGGHVRGSTQRPAQTFWSDLPDFHNDFGNVPEVIFYCGSSAGRGPRCAAWYQDYLDERGLGESKALVLAEGAKGWLKRYQSEPDLVDVD